MNPRVSSVLCCIVLLTTAVVADGPPPAPEKPTPASGVRFWLERLPNLDTEEGSRCNDTSDLFLFSTRHFKEPEAEAEFSKFASDDDTLKSWIARWKITKTDQDRKQLAATMLTSSHACIRCKAIETLWYMTRTRERLSGRQERAIRRAWEATRKSSEHLIQVESMGEFARAQIATEPSQGHYFYFRLADGQWNIVCRSGGWIF